MDKQIAVSLKNINKTFTYKTNREKTIRERVLNFLTNRKQTKRTIKALHDINIDIYKGESFGIIGKNGSGKSTLLNIIMETYKPDLGGKIKTNGEIMRLALGLGVDNNLTARENIYLNGSIIGIPFKEIGENFSSIIEFAGLEEFVNTPVKFYSKGMRQRLKFSIAMYANADIFLLDEFFGGTGDEEFKQKSDIAFENRIINGKTNIIVSHSMQIIRKHCKRVLWIQKGRIKDIGPAENVIRSYLANNNLNKKKSNQINDENIQDLASNFKVINTKQSLQTHDKIASQSINQKGRKNQLNSLQKHKKERNITKAKDSPKTHKDSPK